jgi:hypothetical protein
MNKESINILVHMLPSYLEKQIKIPAVQREANVWTEEQKQLLIDSLYNSFDVPKIYCRKSEDGANVWWLIDGQQRVTSIIQFLRGEFALGSGSSLPQRVHGKRWRELDPNDQGLIGSQALNFVIMSCSDDEEEDMFLRLNNGTPLSAAERRNAIKGKMRDLVAKLAKDSFFVKRVAFKPKRFAHDAVCAQLVLLVLSEGPADAKGPSLRAMYQDYREKIPNEKDLASDVAGTLQWLSKIFPKCEPFMKKFTVVSYFLFLFELKRDYACKAVSNKQLRAFFDAFELDRAENARRAPDDPKFDFQIGAYQAACNEGPDRADSIRTRHEVLLTRFLSDHCSIELKKLDAQRSFSHVMKTAIYLRAGRKCVGVSRFRCPSAGKELSFEACQFDHVKEHASGGRTSVDNGQVLCAKCHAEKTRRFNSKKDLSR